MIAVGMMDRRISLSAWTTVTDTDYGGNDEGAWSDQATVWAHVIWKGGKINEAGEQMQNNQVVEFYIRNGGNAQDIGVQWKVVYLGADFYIDAIDAIDGREKYLRIITTKVTDVANTL